jgi:hypothetical protein
MSYILTLIVLLSLANPSLSQSYNCSKCYNYIKQSRYLYNYCYRATGKNCHEYYLETNRVGILLCNYIVKERCIKMYNDEL